MNSSSFLTNDLFREKFKYYKANKPPPSLNEVIKDPHTHKRICEITLDYMQEDSRASFLGLKDLREWNTFTVKDHPGLLYIKNPFTSPGQRYWIRKCLQAYTIEPNKSNIDTEVDLNDWWTSCHNGNVVDRVLQKKLRWITLGYHHNWDTKVYCEQNRGCFPEDLAELCDLLANYLGYTKFKPQAAIVNYYHMDSTLSPHTDHSEINLEAPLFSISFGQSAVFLIGGTDKSISPSAILLESGDILVMSKEARLCYHAVPKILPASESPWNRFSTLVNQKPTLNCINLRYISNQNDIELSMNKTKDNVEWLPFNNYISKSRINLNVRQVLNESQERL